MGRRKKSDQDSMAPSYVNRLQRTAANNRERTRMRILSKAFSRLKTALPWVPNDTKLSKLDTLRLASSYIAHLTQILSQDSNEPLVKIVFDETASQFNVDILDSLSNSSVIFA